MMAIFLGIQRTFKRAKISWAFLIFLSSEVRKPVSLYKAPYIWAVANVYWLSVYKLITLFFPYLRPWVRAISSAFWAEVPCPSAWA
jgi:hypothetical protein